MMTQQYIHSVAKYWIAGRQICQVFIVCHSHLEVVCNLLWKVSQGLWQCIQVWHNATTKGVTWPRSGRASIVTGACTSVPLLTVLYSMSTCSCNTLTEILMHLHLNFFLATAPNLMHLFVHWPTPSAVEGFPGHLQLIDLSDRSAGVNESWQVYGIVWN